MVRPASKTLSGVHVRYFGPTKVLYSLSQESKTKDAAELKASRIRRSGYGARITHEGGKYQVWESHSPLRRR